MAKLTPGDQTVKFRRKTFSLTEYQDNLLRDLEYKHGTIKATQSDLVKAALHLVKQLDTDELIKVLKEVQELGG